MTRCLAPASSTFWLCERTRRHNVSGKHIQEKSLSNGAHGEDRASGEKWRACEVDAGRKRHTKTGSESDVTNNVARVPFRVVACAHKQR